MCGVMWCDVMHARRVAAARMSVMVSVSSAFTSSSACCCATCCVCNDAIASTSSATCGVPAILPIREVQHVAIHAFQRDKEVGQLVLKAALGGVEVGAALCPVCHVACTHAGCPGCGIGLLQCGHVRGVRVWCWHD